MRLCRPRSPKNAGTMLALRLYRNTLTSRFVRRCELRMATCPVLFVFPFNREASPQTGRLGEQFMTRTLEQFTIVQPM